MGDAWTKVRHNLFEDPKLIAMARHLWQQEAFVRWVIPARHDEDDPLPDRVAIRHIGVSLLLRVWSVARAQGVFDGEDLRLPNLELFDLDQIAGAPGIGDAMGAVGWAVENESGVTLPNFKEFNVPFTPAEKQKAWRVRNPRPAKSPTLPKEPKPPKRTDEQWLADLAKEEAYRGVDVAREYSKAAVWTREHQRKLSRQFFVNWLNRAEKPMNGGTSRGRSTSAENQENIHNFLAEVKERNG